MSWDLFHVDGNVLLFNCTLEKSNLLHCCISDFKHIWSESCTEDEVLSRAQELNKRIGFDKATILKTITTSPTQSEIESVSQAESLGEKFDLNLKYYLSERPLKFKWMLKQLPQEKFLSMITNPLLLSVRTLLKQNEELKSIIEKKDAEIEEYKLEGATLSRYKLETEPFSREDFERKHPYEHIEGFIKYTNEKFEHIKDTYEKEFPMKKEDKSEKTKDIFATKDKTKKSPKGIRNLQLLRTKTQIHQTRLRNQNSVLRFEDSDSCTPPMEDDIAEIIRSNEELKRKQQEDLESKNYPNAKKVKETRRALNL